MRAAIVTKSSVLGGGEARFGGRRRALTEALAVAAAMVAIAAMMVAGYDRAVNHTRTCHAGCEMAALDRSLGQFIAGHAATSENADRGAAKPSQALEDPWKKPNVIILHESYGGQGDDTIRDPGGVDLQCR